MSQLKYFSRDNMINILNLIRQVMPKNVSDLTNDKNFVSKQEVINMGSTTAPKEAGEASIGTEEKFARGDHVHPHDSTKQDVSDMKNYETTSHATTTYATKTEMTNGLSKKVDNSEITKYAKIENVYTKSESNNKYLEKTASSFNGSANKVSHTLRIDETSFDGSKDVSIDIFKNNALKFPNGGLLEIIKEETNSSGGGTSGGDVISTPDDDPGEAPEGYPRSPILGGIG